MPVNRCNATLQHNDWCDERLVELEVLLAGALLPRVRVCRRAELVHRSEGRSG
jgi:hypothetical protein